MGTITPVSQAGQPAADPVALISSLIAAEKVTPNPKPAPQEAPAEAPAQPEGEAEQPANNAQVEGDDAPGEGERAAVAEIPLDQLEAIELEVEISGENGKRVEKVPIKELRLGYMRQKDYSVKTADVARQRDEVGQKVRQGIEGERTQYMNTLQQLQSAVIEAAAPELKSVDWNKLATDDPFEYVRLRNRADQVGNVLNGINQRIQAEKAKADTETLEANRERARKAWTELESDIPGWNQEVYQSAIKAAEALGFQQSEAGAWLDARQLKLLHKAYLYDQLKAGTPSAEKRVAVAPKAITPGTTTAVSRKTQESNQAKERLRKSGRIEDLASYLSSRL